MKRTIQIIIFKLKVSKISNGIILNKPVHFINFHYYHYYNNSINLGDFYKEIPFKMIIIKKYLSNYSFRYLELGKV